MQYHASGSTSTVWDSYWFEKNLQGDIVAIYDNSGTKLISYTYDAWGNFTPPEASEDIPSVVTNNPFTYRGYYYDYDLGLYYLQSRYYDSEIGRFISADSHINANGDIVGFNMYAYCSNNPVIRIDAGGQFWDTVFDVVSLAFSVADVIANPSDPWAWVGLVGDIVDLIPLVSGVGEATDLIRVATKADKAVDVIDNTVGSYKTLKKANKGTGLEVHHIVEKRFAKDLGIENTDEMLSIALTKSDHRVYTNAWRKEIGYKTGPHSPQEIWGAAQRIYIDRPDLLEAARKTIFRR